ncbi:MAG: DNA repair protein RadA [Oscillospiraceae bacterium]|nr:DNA repair protein RadA [Oscillospiraceae bacterium]
MKTKSLYVCVECGHEHLKWAGKCAACGEWNCLEEYAPSSGVSTSELKGGLALKTTTLENIDSAKEIRHDMQIGELNRVLGGGLVKGSLVLLSGEPGIGKSTLLIQLGATSCLKSKTKILYISGEESERQIKLRAQRLKINSPDLLLAVGTDCAAIIKTALEQRPDIMVIDSIQTLSLNSISSSAGSVTQVRECTSLLMKLAKEEEISIFLVGHVNKDGGVAGPKVLEHIVDTVLTFEGDRNFSYRILRAVKNRFGSANEIGVFEMGEMGLTEVPNPSALMLAGRPKQIGGISIHCAMEGSRPILAEVQALVTKTGFGQPRRVSNGFDYNRLCMLLAVLEKRTGFLFGAFDVYVNIIGGLKIDEPAADVAIALALFSGLCDKPIAHDVAAFGEIGLGGEIRNVSNINERLKECKRMGFKKVFIPNSKTKTPAKTDDFEVVKVGRIGELFSQLTVDG